MNIAAACVEDPFRSARVIRQYLGLDQSADSINRVLRAMGFKSRHAASKTKLSDEDRQRRVAWSSLYLNEINWSSCLFADESCFSSSREGIKLVKRPVGHRFDPNYTNKTNHCARKLVSVFGIIYRNGVGPLVRLDSRLTGPVYTELMDSYAIPFIRDNFGLNEATWIEDNCPAHTCVHSSHWFSICNALHEVNISRMNLPPYSPDLNIIENVWGHLKYQLLYDEEPQSADHLWQMILGHWNQLNSDQELFTSLYNSMNSRLESIMNSNGYPLKY